MMLNLLERLSSISKKYRIERENVTSRIGKLAFLSAVKKATAGALAASLTR
tara:strand:- start:338 stop:490 length:153 start_codon:yes stop_codon:yes gene_type:complete